MANLDDLRQQLRAKKALKSERSKPNLDIKIQAGTKRYSSEAEHYYHLAECYIDGIEGYEENTALAFENYLKAAEKGHVLAMIELAYDYCDDESVLGLDLFKAEYWAKKAIEAGDPDGYFELYKINASRFLRAEAVKCLDQGIAQGSLDCMEERAYILLYGYSLEADIKGKIDYDEALSLLERVEWDSRHPHAFTMLGDLYQQKGCLQDAKINYEKAMTLLPDDAAIKYMLGCLLRLEGVQDLPAAKALLEQSAEMDVSTAMNDLGVMLYLGQGCEQNMSVAIEWFRKAAQNGHHTAMINLYDILSKEKPEEARYWLNKAAEEGDETAKERVKALDNTESVDLSLSKKIYDDEHGNFSSTLEKFDLSEHSNSSSGYSDRNDDFIKNKIIEIVADKLCLDEDEVHTYSRIGEDLGADSLDAVELIMEMEKEFNITIPDSAAEKVRTVGDIITYVKTHR